MKISLKEKTIFWRKWEYETEEQARYAESYRLTEFDDYECYLACSLLKDKKYRYFGHKALYYDCQWFEAFGFYFFAIQWSSRLTSKRLWRKYNDKEI